MTLRPYGLVMDGRLEIGLELAIEGGAVTHVRPHTGIPEPFVVSSAFVNAHSHLEYRGLQGQIREREWWPWIRSITQLKVGQDLEEVRGHTLLAAQENRQTGVALIGEHADRPFSGEAMSSSGLQGIIFQEVITLFEAEAPGDKLASVEAKALEQRKTFAGQVVLNPHAIYTVDAATLARFGASGDPISLHLAESPAESEFTRSGAGPIGDFCREAGVAVRPTGAGVFETAWALGLIRKGAQIVHACDLDESDFAQLAASGAAVAHCPRSNEALGCPPARIREMLDAGITVGLGMDSAASSGPIDMFAEMRAAMALSERRGAAVTPEEAWRMATSGGADSLGRESWHIRPGSTAPLIKIHVEGAWTTEDLIERGSPESVEWV